jgi:GT2 family glycosyltransferase
VVTCIFCGDTSGWADDFDHRQSTLTSGLTVAVCTYKRPHSIKAFMDSLPGQDQKPERLVIVDASPNDATEQMVRNYVGLENLAHGVQYFRVKGAFDTLTCSRNFALRQVTTDIMAFFDDDIILLPGCLREMVATHRRFGEEVSGVGAIAENQIYAPPLLWKMRKWLGIVPHLQPGKYARSGVSLPWSFQAATDELIEGDWLSGCSMMWKTAIAREIGFNERFGGHSMGEDLDFSLRMGQRGKLMVNGKARVLHMIEPAGRPNSYMLGYTGMRNAHLIHRECLKNRTWLDALWFVYAYFMDSLIRMLGLVRPGVILQRWRFLLGRLRFFLEMPFMK